MKKVKVPLPDFISVLEAMEEAGALDVIIFDYQGMPAIADADDPDNFVTFQVVEGDEEFVNEDGDQVH